MKIWGIHKVRRTVLRQGTWRTRNRSSVSLALALLGLALWPAAFQTAFSSESRVAGPAVLPSAVEEGSLADPGQHGGLIVVAGCQDAERLLTLGNHPNTLVHGLVPAAGRLDDVRQGIRAAGVYGRVSAASWEGATLPYGDGMVNLLLAPDERLVPAAAEIERVLAPGGMARIGPPGSERCIRKGWPPDVDVWTHSRYDATGNAVSADRCVGPPRFLQWEATPRWNRGVKTSGLVSTGGRIFYVLDDSHFTSTQRTWSLIARDAFNGIQLWRHELASWAAARGGKKVGPVQMHRRLVAHGDRVYAALAEFAPVSVLDAASGDVLRTLEETEPAAEFLLSDGVLVALVDPNTDADRRRGTSQAMRLVAVDPESGNCLWRHETARILPMTLAADGSQVVYHDGTVIKSLDLRTGTARWSSPPTGQDVVLRDQANPDSPGAEPGTIILAPQFAPTLIIYDEVIAFAGGRQLNVVSAKDGNELWRADYAATNYSVPVDLFGFQGCLWGPDAGMNLWRPLDDNLDFNAYDPQTGTLRKSVQGNYDFRFQHHRCHQMKVVDNMVIAARAGIEFLDTDTGDVAAHHWTRGSCYFGILPANGLLYTPPHDCACYIRAKLSGFLAMKSAPPARAAEIPDPQRLERGPAFGQTAEQAAQTRPDDWPTYRHDPARSGRASTQLKTDLGLGWQAQFTGSRLTSPVIADRRVFLADMDAHLLYALDALRGDLLWQHDMGSRIDAPPTVQNGLVLCGCRDGSVHALRAADGALAWRFRASPAQRLIVSRGQLESAWPVPGSVLVVKDRVYFAAGRSSYLDGGMRLYGLDPHTGRTLVDTVISSRHADGSQQLDEQGVDGYLNDILSSDGSRIFMRHQAFDLDGNPLSERLTHLHSPDGFLSGDTTTRLLWTYAPLFTSPHQGAFYDVRLARTLFPSGRILVEDTDTIYGFGQNHYARANTEPGGQWALFAADKRSDVPLDRSAIEYRKLALAGKHPVRFPWWQQLPIQVWAMLQSDEVLFVAGPQGSSLTSAAALTGQAEAQLLAISTADGSVLAEWPLPAAPVWDGLAAAGGSLYVALTSGQLLCLWSPESGRPGLPLPEPAWRAALPPLAVADEPGLVGRWRFDEGQGQLARDSSGRGHDAIVSGDWATTERGTCLVAGGVPQAAVIPDAPHLHFGNDDFSLALWVQIDQYDVRLLGKEAFPENWWVINVLPNGRAELVLGEGRGPGRSVRATTDAPLATGVWLHLAAVVDRQAGEVRWYLNGELDSRHPIPATMTGGLHAAGSDLAIPSKHKPFRGRFRDFRIYRQAIEVARLQEMVRAQTPPSSGTDESER
jgi:outer membrane protein assembly factor BamB